MLRRGERPDPISPVTRGRALPLLEFAIGNGLQDAAQTLSRVTGRDVLYTPPFVDLVPLKNVPQMVGGADTPAVAIYLGVSGSLNGHFFFLFSPLSSRQFVSLLLEESFPSDAPLDNMAYSALGEMGNIVGCSFLGSLAEATGFQLLPTSPQVVEDFAGSILEETLAALSGFTDEAVIIQAGFSEAGTAISGYILFLPDTESMSLLLAALEKPLG